MRRAAKELLGYRLQGIDGELGDVEDLYFDDSKWRIRYFVVNTGSWLSGRRVLLSPLALTGVPRDDRRINVALTTDQVRNSPDIDLHRPVSRQEEIDLHTHYGWMYYGFGGLPMEIPRVAVPDDRARAPEPPKDPADRHLRSVKEVTGYRVSATDGNLGHVEDFVVDHATWDVAYLVVDTAPLWMGKKVLIFPGLVEDVDWGGRAVALGLTQDQIEQAPEWDGSYPVEPRYGDKLQAHYNRLSYVV